MHTQLALGLDKLFFFNNASNKWQLNSLQGMYGSCCWEQVYQSNAA